MKLNENGLTTLLLIETFFFGMFSYVLSYGNQWGIPGMVVITILLVMIFTWPLGVLVEKTIGEWVKR